MYLLPHQETAYDALQSVCASLMHHLCHAALQILNVFVFLALGDMGVLPGNHPLLALLGIIRPPACSDLLGLAFTWGFSAS